MHRVDRTVNNHAQPPSRNSDDRSLLLSCCPAALRVVASRFRTRMIAVISRINRPRGESPRHLPIELAFGPPRLPPPARAPGPSILINSERILTLTFTGNGAPIFFSSFRDVPPRRKSIHPRTGGRNGTRCQSKHRRTYLRNCSSSSPLPFSPLSLRNSCDRGLAIWR